MQMEINGPHKSAGQCQHPHRDPRHKASSQPTTDVVLFAMVKGPAVVSAPVNTSAPRQTLRLNVLSGTQEEKWFHFLLTANRPPCCCPGPPPLPLWTVWTPCRLTVRARIPIKQEGPRVILTVRHFISDFYFFFYGKEIKVKYNWSKFHQIQSSKLPTN